MSNVNYNEMTNKELQALIDDFELTVQAKTPNKPTKAELIATLEAFKKEQNRINGIEYEEENDELVGEDDSGSTKPKKEESKISKITEKITEKKEEKKNNKKEEVDVYEYGIQYGAFKTSDYAKKLADKLLKSYNIKTIVICGKTIHNIKCIVMDSDESENLLGISVLKKLGKITIDFNNLELLSDNSK